MSQIVRPWWYRRWYYRHGQIYLRTPAGTRTIADVAIGNDTRAIGRSINAIWNEMMSIDPDDPVGAARECAQRAGRP